MSVSTRARRRTVVVACLLAIALPAALATPVVAGQQGPNWDVVADGFDNPRGIDVVNGKILVAESGRGGNTCKTFPSPEDPQDPPITLCLGYTGSITQVTRDGEQTVLTRLPSIADPSGFAATGPSDVSAQGPLRRYISMGEFFNISAEFGPAAQRLGDLLLTTPHGTRSLVDLWAFEEANNPDGAEINSNLNGVWQLGGGDGVLIADAAANALLRSFAPSGRTHVVATLPDQRLPLPDAPEQKFPADPVPTTVTVGPDGAWYVGELKGFPFTLGKSRIWRIEPGTQDAECRAKIVGPCSLYAKGFTAIIDIDFAPDGSLYVLEIAKNGLLAAEGGDFTGALIRVEDGVRTEVASEGLVAPAGVAISSRGRIFVTNFGIFPGQGQVVEVHT